MVYCPWPMVTLWPSSSTTSPARHFLPRMVQTSPFTLTAPFCTSSLASPPVSHRPAYFSRASSLINSVWMRIFCMLRLSIVLETDGQDEIQEVVPLGGQDLDRAQRAADLQPDLLGAGIPQRIQQIAVVEADLHIVAFAFGVELVHNAAQIGLAADYDFTLCKTDAEGIF